MAIPKTAPANDYGKSLSLGLAGSVIGCLAIGLVTGFWGVWPLFFAIPAFLVHLVLSALVGAVATAMGARLWKRPLANKTIMAVAAVLTFLLFAALPLYFVLLAPSQTGGLLFH